MISNKSIFSFQVYFCTLLPINYINQISIIHILEMYIDLEEGFKIRYDEYGKDKQKHILFIHGLGSSPIVWRDIPQALSEYFHTISIDLIGFGESDKPQLNYTISYFAQFIKNFLTQIGIKDKDKIIIIGHSLGGYIAIEYAIENKTHIEKLVLIDSSGM